MTIKPAGENNILLRKEMEGIKIIDVLHARIEGIALVRSKVSAQFQ
jgi:hypothetical protein